MSQKAEIGRLFLAVHSVFTWRPRYDANPLAVWSWWWLWFEVSWSSAALSSARGEG